MSAEDPPPHAASPARDRLPADHRPSHIPCTHSFRTNGGYTDARIDRLSTAATRRIGAGHEIPSVKRSGFGSPRAGLIRGAMIGPAAAQASAQGATGPSGACKHPPLTGPALAAACCSALSASSNADSVGFRYRPDPSAAAGAVRLAHAGQRYIGICSILHASSSALDFSEKLVWRCAVGARGGLSLTASG